MKLAMRGGLKIALIEAENELSMHQSGHNSGVIHSGIYYKPGSLKAENCIKGRELLYKYLKKKNIPFNNCGKLIVATEENEIAELNRLKNNGEQNGLKGIKSLTSEDVKNIEPNIRAIEALFVEESGIVDYKKVVNAYAEDFTNAGGTIFTSNRVNKIFNENSNLKILTKENSFAVKYLINCGGLESDRVAKMCNINPLVKIIPFKGEYYILKDEFSNLFTIPVYPVPDPELPFLGVHFTKTVDGTAEAGPNAVLAFKRYGYSKFSFSLKDTLDTLLYPGFWKMASRQWKTGIMEMHRSLSKRKFVSSLKKLMPAIEKEQIVTGGCGIRAQAMDKNGNLINDFKIETTKNQIHILNSPSPAATSSLAIAKTIEDMAVEKFNL
ncbi:MAG: L-2-hydroxyglutarate oxidase [Deltaproteobacteria bacterium]|nr:L-2-hydroxyglutarate oxidase [Deltaproteobacteria bacterium]